MLNNKLLFPGKGLELQILQNYLLVFTGFPVSTTYLHKIKWVYHTSGRDCLWFLFIFKHLFHIFSILKNILKQVGDNLLSKSKQGGWNLASLIQRSHLSAIDLNFWPTNTITYLSLLPDRMTCYCRQLHKE